MFETYPLKTLDPIRRNDVMVVSEETGYALIPCFVVGNENLFLCFGMQMTDEIVRMSDESAANEG